MESRRPTNETAGRKKIIQWLSSQPEAEITIAATRPDAQRIAAALPAVGVHWLTEATTIDDLQTMAQRLEVSHLILGPDAMQHGDHWQFLIDPDQFKKGWQPVFETEGPFLILRSSGVGY